MADTESLDVAVSSAKKQTKTCHMLQVTCYMAPTATATAKDPPPANACPNRCHDMVRNISIFSQDPLEIGYSINSFSIFQTIANNVFIK